MQSVKIECLKRRYFWHGTAQLVIGIFPMLMPLVSNFATASFIGTIFLLEALPSIWNAFSGFRDGDKPWPQTFMSLIMTTAGLVFLFHPLAGMITMSLFLASFFLVDGIMIGMESWRVRSAGGALWISLSGIIRVAFSMILWSDFLSDIPMLGMLLGVNLIFNGTAFIMMGKNRKAT